MQLIALTYYFYMPDQRVRILNEEKRIHQTKFKIQGQGSRNHTIHTNSVKSELKSLIMRPILSPRKECFVKQLFIKIIHCVLCSRRSQTIHAFLQWFSSHSIVTLFGLSSGNPRARSQISYKYPEKVLVEFLGKSTERLEKARLKNNHSRKYLRANAKSS